MSKAKDFYKSAEAAIKDGRFLDAARDYGAAYEITRDPVLFYKIGSANERAGKCDVALIYYGRYLREARPADSFVAMTRERIVACHGDPNADQKGSGSGTGSATVQVTTGSGSDAGSAVTGVGSGLGSATPPPPPAHVSSSNKAAWIMVAGTVAFATVGAVLAYSASSSENDVSDLYVGLGGQPPVFDAKTKQTYQDYVDEGNRDQTLSWVSFGLAGATAITAAILFYRHHNAEHSEVSVAPAVSPTGGGFAASVRF